MTTLAFLKRRITRGLVREDIDDEELMGWVASATNRINNELRVRKMITDASILLTKNSFSLPLGFLAVNSLSVSKIGSTGLGSTLIYSAPDELAAQPKTFGTGYPTAYTIQGQSLVISPFSALNAKINMGFFRRVPHLIEDNDTNFVLTDFSDLYFNAAMVYGHQFYLEYEMADKREARVLLEIDRANTAFKGEKYNDGPIIVPPARRMGGRFS